MKFSNCFYPRIIRNKYTDERLVVSCGRCPACLERRHLDLVTRLKYEASLTKYVLFFTLTYDEKSVPALRIYKSDGSYWLEKMPYRLGDGNYIDKRVSVDSRLYDAVDLDSYGYEHGFDDVDIDFYKKRDFIRVCCKDDVKHFIKTVQNHLNYNYNEKVRYFITSEYGPKRLRPHYHGLFFTNEKQIAKELYKIVLASWQFGHIDASFAKSSALGYVAKYLNGSANYPKVFGIKVLRPFVLYSKRPAIGSVEVGSQEFQKILFDRTRQVELAENTRVKAYSFWQALENRVFPRCRNFGKLTRNGRAASYLVGLKFYKEYKEFKEKTLTSSILTFLRVIHDDDKLAINRELSDYRLSFRFLQVCETYGLDVMEYIDIIDNYYSLRALDFLREFYSFQEYISSEQPWNLKYLVNLYPLFFNDLCDTEYDFLPNLCRRRLATFGIDLDDYMSVDGIFDRDLFRSIHDFDLSQDYVYWRTSVLQRDFDNSKTKLLNDCLNILND